MHDMSPARRARALPHASFPVPRSLCKFPAPVPRWPPRSPRLPRSPPFPFPVACRGPPRATPGLPLSNGIPTVFRESYDGMFGGIAFSAARGELQGRMGGAGMHRNSTHRKTRLPSCLGSAIESMTCGTEQTWANQSGHKCSCGLWRRLLPHVFAAIGSTMGSTGGCDELTHRLEGGAVYQFGVFDGGSMQMLRHMKPFAKASMFGFDSFQGLPSDFLASERALWSPGQFSSDPRVRLRHELGREGAPVHFVSGFFNDSLRPGLGHQLGMQPAKFVDVDVDLYSSAAQVLDFMFSDGLIRAGTLIGYDDWWSGPCRRGWGSMKGAVTNPLKIGEGLAHAELAHKYGVNFICVAGGCSASVPCTAFGVIFLVVRIGDERGGDPGFAMSDNEVSEFMERDPVCHAKKAKKHVG